MELVIVSFLKTMFIVAGASAFGPHQEAPRCETVAIMSDRVPGKVLYRNLVDPTCPAPREGRADEILLEEEAAE